MERKYRMTRVRKGDYLLPSNDKKTLWRIYSYEEDGSALSGVYPNEKPIVGVFWAAAKYDRPLDQIPDRHFEYDTYYGEVPLLEWDHWILEAQLLKTREEAIAYVMMRRS